MSAWTEIGTSVCACLLHLLFSLPLIYSPFVFLHIVWNLQNVLLNQKSGPVAPLNRMAGGVRSVLLGLYLSRWRERSCFPSLFILGRLPEQLFYSCWQIPPSEFQSATDATIPQLKQEFGCIQAVRCVDNTSTGTYELLWQYAETNTLDSANQIFLWISQPQH